MYIGNSTPAYLMGTSIYDGVRHTRPWADFPWSPYPHLEYSPSVVGNISRRAFRRRIVRYWHPLGCRAIELGKPPQGGVMHTVVPGKHLLTIHFGHSSFVWPMLLFSFSVSQGVKTRFAVGFSCRHGAGQKRGFLLGKSVDILYE